MSNEQQQPAAPGAFPTAAASVASATEVNSVTDHSPTYSLGAGSNNEKPEPRVPHIRIVPHIVDVHKGLYFDVMSRSVPDSTVLKVGRFTDKVSQQMSRIAFRSKVVSRSHAEIWTENGHFFIKDTKSSSGTFLNHMRLSPPGVESRPYPLHDGDILQLGVDYQGGKIDVYKCVIIRLEINRNWQWNSENPFRRQVLENIQNAYHNIGAGSGGAGDNGSSGDNNECCICLYPMIAFQALFVAPCSHCFHYKCVKPILFTSTSFNCPLCRTYADLEASVTVDENEMEVDAKPAALPPVIQSITHPMSATDSRQQQQHQHRQPSSLSEVGVAAAAAAEAAVQAAESGAVPRDIAPSSNADAAAVAMGRDDSNATPVPGEHANVDSFGTTPVGSMPTDMSHIGAAMADADASLVGTSSQQQQQQQQQQRGADSSDQVMHSVSSPALSSTDNINAGIVDSSTGADICNNGQQQQQQQQQGSSPQNNAAN